MIKPGFENALEYRKAQMENIKYIFARGYVHDTSKVCKEDKEMMEIFYEPNPPHGSTTLDLYIKETPNRFDLQISVKDDLETLQVRVRFYGKVERDVYCEDVHIENGLDSIQDVISRIKHFYHNTYLFSKN